MNLIELRDILNKEIERGLGDKKLLVLNGDGIYENANGLEYDKTDDGYVIY